METVSIVFKNESTKDALAAAGADFNNPVQFATLPQVGDFISVPKVGALALQVLARLHKMHSVSSPGHWYLIVDSAPSPL